jgi:hypothetical protein
MKLCLLRKPSTKGVVAEAESTQPATITSENGEKEHVFEEGLAAELQQSRPWCIHGATTDENVYFRVHTW